MILTPGDLCNDWWTPPYPISPRLPLHTVLIPISATLDLAWDKGYNRGTLRKILPWLYFNEVDVEPYDLLDNLVIHVIFVLQNIPSEVSRKGYFIIFKLVHLYGNIVGHPGSSAYTPMLLALSTAPSTTNMPPNMDQTTERGLSWSDGAERRVS